MPAPIVAIRPASSADHHDLERLAGLDSARIPTGDLLIGIVDGEPVAAVAVADGSAIADPFRPTADIVALLRLRAQRLRDGAPDRVLRRRLRSLLPA